MADYFYRGVIPASKSLMNRALICASYFPELILHGQSQCDDVVRMRDALLRLPSKDVDCGAAGSVFRFLALRVSRLQGRFVLRGTTRLLSRPHQDLLEILSRLGSQVTTASDHWVIISTGWQNLDAAIQVRRNISSQFASGIILNAWNLKQDLHLEMPGVAVSEGYLSMTLKMVRQLGMRYEQRENSLIIRAHSEVQMRAYEVESDVSSLFAVAAFATLNGNAVFDSFPQSDLQPDRVFVGLLRMMGAPITCEQSQLRVQRALSLQGIEANLASCPDLFPVLATVCAFAQTKSRLYGASQLVHKESNRIAKTSELLRLLGVPHRVLPDGMEIQPVKGAKPCLEPFTYDTDHDHRLAFAAALVRSQKIPIQIIAPNVVSKSFPEFWKIIKMNPDEVLE